MNGSVNRKKTENSIDVITRGIEILFFVMLFVTIVGMIWFTGIDRTEPITYNDVTFIEEWNVTSPSGKEFTAGSSMINDTKEKGEFVITGKLPDVVTDGSYFCAIIGGDGEIYVNGDLRKDYIASRDMVIPGGIVKRFYIRVPLTSSDSGAEISMMRYGSGRVGYLYQDTFVADDSAFFKYMMSHYGLSFMLEEILLIFSIVIVIAGFFMMIHYRRKIELLYGAMSVAVIAGWLITNSYLFPFLYGHYHIDGVFNYMLCLLMPFCPAFYLDALQHGRHRKYTNVALGMASVSLIVFPVLHLTNLFSFAKALVYINILIGIELLIAAWGIIKDLISGDIKDYIYTAIGFSGFFVCGIMEIIALDFLPVINGDLFMLAGLVFMLTLTVVQQMADLRKVREEGQRALDLSEAKTKFLASMSHEIRTPINAILGMNEMILRENRDPVIGEYADSVKSSGQMLLMLVNDVLDFSKIEAGKMEINDAQFTFSSLLLSIMPMLKERAGAKELNLQTVILNEIPDGMISDEFRIRQILINLINNAIKYTDKGSVTLMLGGEYTGDDSFSLRMNVKDTGRGISEEDQKTLFEAFARADVKKNRNIEGTGLGLAIVKSIVDSMSGEISVESKYGEGSEFRVILPVGVADRTPLDEDYEKHTVSRVSDNKECDYTAPEASILAVDDNNSNLKIVKLFLKRAGIEPELCDNGTKAFELCKTKKYDLILLDHMMPDPDGIKTLELIRSDEASMNRDTPAIVLTANALAGSRKLYTDAGFADYLTKPLDSALLEKTIKQYLPAEKILSAQKPAEDDESLLVMEFLPEDTEADSQSSGTDSFRKKLERIEGLDYDSALTYQGDDEELLKAVIGIITDECEEKTDSMRKSVSSKDWHSYALQAHSLKGLLLSIGLKDLSERAKKHEFAGKNQDIDFIMSDYEAFLKAYEDICRRLKM